MNETNAEPYPGQFRIVWNSEKAEYRVSIPDYNGGEVVPLETVKSLEAHQSARIAELERELSEHKDEWDRLEMTIEEAHALRAEVERLTKVLTRANPPPERAYECLTLLDSAGLGKPGAPHGNTLTGMTHEAVELIATLRAQLAEREEDRALLARLSEIAKSVRDATVVIFAPLGPSDFWRIEYGKMSFADGDTLRAAIRAARAQPEDGK